MNRSLIAASLFAAVAGLVLLSPVGASPASAQPHGYGPPPGYGAGPGYGPGPGMRRGNPDLRANRFACRQEALARGYRPPHVRGAVIECLRARRPDLARIVECRQNARMHGYVPRTPPFRMAVRACRFGA
ncbi:MAG: hypothetical protein Q8S29_02755 [Phreatobacter sp.]|nr:hypothetical protein [Phreatobacter sp.]